MPKNNTKVDNEQPETTQQKERNPMWDYAAILALPLVGIAASASSAAIRRLDKDVIEKNPGLDKIADGVGDMLIGMGKLVKENPK